MINVETCEYGSYNIRQWLLSKYVYRLKLLLFKTSMFASQTLPNGFRYNIPILTNYQLPLFDLVYLYL